ncbi:MAG: radical SAM protein [Desulfatiglans sp.]|nr:radical SAM protein [Desulfatiglans sp.]
MPGSSAHLSNGKPARELGAIKKEWGGKISFALVYPNRYYVGMSNLGFQIVYRLLNDRDDVVAERVFLPEDTELSLHPRAGSGLISMESRALLSRFDLIAFSISFENDYPNILNILDLAHIPLKSEERDESSPLVMAGGVTTFLNPEPISDYIDFFLLGEAEENLNPFIDLFKGVAGRGSSRKELLQNLAKGMGSIYVPSLYHVDYDSEGTITSRGPLIHGIPDRISSAVTGKADLTVNSSTIISDSTEFADKLLVELGRGCGRSCRFCAAGFVYRPPRYQDAKKVIASIDESSFGCGEIGLLSASVLDTPGITNIAEKILACGKTFSLSSLRADLLNEEMLILLKKAGQKHIAIAPEAGSERLRRVINKHLTHEQITNAVRLIARVGKFSLRLYFLIGLPTETMDDVAAIYDLIKKIKHSMVSESKARGEIGQIRLSVNCFIPKPFTPFQWFPMEDMNSLKEKQRFLKKSLSKEGGVTVTFDVPKWAYLQTLLSMGDRRAGAILKKAHGYGDDFTKAFRDSELNADFFVNRPRNLDEILPWDFIDHGIKKRSLIEEYKLALKETESAICDPGNCIRCGVCER